MRLTRWKGKIRDGRVWEQGGESEKSGLVEVRGKEGGNIPCSLLMTLSAETQTVSERVFALESVQAKKGNEWTYLPKGSLASQMQTNGPAQVVV